MVHQRMPSRKTATHTVRVTADHPNHTENLMMIWTPNPPIRNTAYKIYIAYAQYQWLTNDWLFYKMSDCIYIVCFIMLNINVLCIHYVCFYMICQAAVNIVYTFKKKTLHYILYI